MYLIVTNKILEAYKFEDAGSWKLRKGAAFLPLKEEDDLIYAYVVRTPKCSILKKILGASKAVYTEEQICKELPKEWDFLTDGEQKILEDGRPVWAVRRSVAGYR